MAGLIFDLASVVQRPANLFVHKANGDVAETVVPALAPGAVEAALDAGPFQVDLAGALFPDNRVGVRARVLARRGLFERDLAPVIALPGAGNVGRIHRENAHGEEADSEESKHGEGSYEERAATTARESRRPHPLPLSRRERGVYCPHPLPLSRKARGVHCPHALPISRRKRGVHCPHPLPLSQGERGGRKWHARGLLQMSQAAFQ